MGKDDALENKADCLFQPEGENELSLIWLNDRVSLILAHSDEKGGSLECLMDSIPLILKKVLPEGGWAKAANTAAKDRIGAIVHWWH